MKVLQVAPRHPPMTNGTNHSLAIPIARIPFFDKSIAQFVAGDGARANIGRDVSDIFSPYGDPGL